MSDHELGELFAVLRGLFDAWIARAKAAPLTMLPAPLVGRAFGEMGAPLAAAKEIEAMPYRVTGVDAYSLTLGAWSRSA